MLTRRGLSLVEVLVALTLAAIVLGTATISVVRQQRTAARVRALVEGEAQLRSATALASSELAALAPDAGDLVPGEASDTALQLRAPVGSGLACGRGVGEVWLASDAPGEVAIAGLLTAPRVSDSLWWYREPDSAWVGRRVTEVAGGQASCPSPLVGSHATTRLGLDAPDSIASGVPLRLTRSVRYSVYRAGDGTWQLGMREWSDASGRFSTSQPVAGPFLRRLAGGERTGFRYFDAAGRELEAGGATAVESGRVARIRFTALARAPGSPLGGDTVLRDSVEVAVANARP